MLIGNFIVDSMVNGSVKMHYSINVSVTTDTTETIEDIDSVIYNMAINNLKDYEGFRGDPYYDTDGRLTVGYGHHIKFEDDFKYPISEVEADTILRRDFNKRIDKAISIHGDELDYNKAIAVGLFIYNCGSSTYRKSTMRRNIDNSIPPDNVWKQYCNYTKTDGTVVYNEKLEERRLFELSLFNYYD